MKKIFVVILLILASLDVFSQIRVKENSFRQIDGFVMLDKNDHYDDNDRPMALIKISTENISAEQRAKLVFKGNLATYFDVHFMTGEIWLYLSTAATFIEIIHPDYGKTEYWLPEDLKGFCGYEMVLVSDYNIGVVNETFNYLIIKTDHDEAKIYINDEFIGKHSIQEPLPIDSSYTWKVECPLYHTRTGEVEISSGAPVSIELKLRPSYGFLNIKSEPSGAEVYVDGVNVGITPYLSDKIESGNHVVELHKKKYLSVKEEVTITDGNTANYTFDLHDKSLTFITLDNAFSLAPQYSIGLSFGKVKKLGWYVSAATGLSFDAYQCDMTCDEFGNVDGEMQLYSGELSTSRLSLIAGVVYRPYDFMAIKVGAGYGMRNVAWLTLDNSLVRNTKYSVNGVDMNAGLLFFINRLSFSIDFISTNAKYAEAKIGVGFCF